MQVLDESLLQAVGVIGHLDQDWNGLEPGPACGPPPALSGDQLKFVGDLVPALADQYGLEDAKLLDRRGQRSHRFIIEMRPGLKRIRLDAADRHLTQGR